MEQPQTEVQEQTLTTSSDRDDRPVPVQPSVESAAHTVSPQACGTAAPHPPPSEVQHPRLPGSMPSAKLRRASPAFPSRKNSPRPPGGPTPRVKLTARHSTPCSPNRRTATWCGQLCFVMTIEGLETYVLVPRDPSDLDLLIDAVRPNPSPLDLDVVIGIKGPSLRRRCATV